MTGWEWHILAGYHTSLAGMAIYQTYPVMFMFMFLSLMYQYAGSYLPANPFQSLPFMEVESKSGAKVSLVIDVQSVTGETLL